MNKRNKNKFDDDFDIFSLEESKDENNINTDFDNSEPINKNRRGKYSNSSTKDVSKGKGKKILKITSISILILFLLSVIFIQGYIILDNYLKGNEDIEIDKKLSESIDKPAPVSPNSDLNDKKEFLNRSSLYVSDLENDESYFTIGLISEEGLSVPVSLILKNEKILSDFGLSNINEVSYLDLYKKYSMSLEFNNLGFIKYHPFSDNLSEVYLSKEDGSVLNNLDNLDNKDFIKILKFEMDSDSISKYDASSASFEILKSSLVDTFYSIYDEIHFVDVDDVPYNFNTAGIGSSKIILDESVNNYGYYVYSLNKESSYLSSNFGQSNEDILDVIENMKNKPNDLYESVIPEDIDFDIELTGTDLSIIFKDELVLSDYDGVEILGLIEGLSLTAKGFGYNLYLKNVNETYWQGFDFSKSLPVPLGANKIYVN